MKLLRFNRKQLLRAIHAAAVALFFLAAQNAAHAQVATGDGHGNITISGSGSNTFDFSTSSTPPLASGGTVTISSGANLSSTASGAYGITIESPSNVTNSGSVYNFNNLTPANALYFSTLSSGNVSVTNGVTGTFSAGSGDNYARGIYVEDVQTGSFNLNNSGLITASNYLNLALGVFSQVDAGPTVLTNNSTGTISATTVSGNYADAVYLRSVTGPITVMNSGTIKGMGLLAPTYGIQVLSGGNVSITNNGLISATHSAYYISQPGTLYGVYANETSSGTLSLTNSSTGTILVNRTAGDATGVYFVAGALSAARVNNAGTISAYGDQTVRGIYVQSSGASTATVNSSGYITTTSVNGASEGIDLYNTGSGSTTISNSGPVQVNAAGVGAGIQWEYTGNTGNANVTNSGAISVTSGSHVYGLIGVNISNPNSTVNDTVSNSGSITLVTNGGSGLVRAQGITAWQGGTQTVSNSGAINISGTSQGVYATGIFCSGLSAVVTNSGAMTLSGYTEAEGVFADGANASHISNTAAITVTGTGSSAYAFALQTLGQYSAVTNSGNLTATGSSQTAGIALFNFNTDATVQNSGNITATDSGAYSASGIYVRNIGGNISINNSGRVQAAATNSTYSGSGIYANAIGGGAVTISNSGYVIGTNSGGGPSYGIAVQGGGPITITNNGTALGLTAGIYSNAAATVNNIGLAGGVEYSIEVASGSTVNLKGASPIIGLMKGGSDDTSTSVLNFQIVVPGNLAAAKAALSAAIADYDQSLAVAAKGPGDDVTSSVVTLNGYQYQWQDFAGITNNLISYAQIPGYGGIGTAIDNFNGSSPQGSAILSALGNLSPRGLPAALAQLSPQSLGVLRNVAFDGAGFTVASVNNHLANQRDGLSGFDTSGFAVNAPGVDPAMTDVRSHLLAWNPMPETAGLLSDSPAALFGGDAKDISTAVNTQPLDRFSSFISGSVILANLDNTLSSLGNSDYTTGSVLAGADYRFNEHFTAGALFDYSHTGADLDANGSEARVDSYTPGVYGSYVDGPWYANALAAYGFNHYGEDRDITITGLNGINHGSTDGGQVTSAMTGGYEFQSGAFKYGPVATLQYVHLHLDSISEYGPTALNIGSQDDDSLRSQLGFEARYSAHCATCYGPMTFTPHVQVSWQHEYMDNSDGITAAFNGAGGGSFVVQGQQPERDSAFIDAGLDAGVADNVTLFIDYKAQAGQDHFFAHSAEGGIRVGF